MWFSIREFVRRLGYWVIVVLLGAAANGIAIFQWTTATTVELVTEWWFVIGNGALLLAAFVAFHRVRQERDEAKGGRPKPIDYHNVDEESEWALYEVAFYWCGYDPPSVQRHRDLFTREMERKHERLSKAAQSGGSLEPAGSGGRGNWSTIRVEHSELKRWFEEDIGEYPPFLFPEERGWLWKIKSFFG